MHKENTSPPQRIAAFYILASKLKTLIRSGWKQWDIAAPRLESVAEHVYGAQMLAIAIWSEFDYKIDLRKTILMLAIHELGETIVGDITPLDQIPANDKHNSEAAAVAKILSGLSNGDEIKRLFDEFEDGKTAEAKFAKQIDKLEAEMQVKLYDQADYCDPDKVRTGFDEEIRQKYIVKPGVRSLSEAWFNYDLEHYTYDENFTEIIKYLKENMLE